MSTEPPHRSTWTAQSDTLGLKALPIMEELLKEGKIVSFDEEHRLERITGHVYRADYYAILDNGMALDVEVDYTAQHAAKSDYRRDRDLAEKGVSTVRINQIEINNGTAKQKIVQAIDAILSEGKVLEPGSTRNRKKEPISPINHNLPSIGLYVAVSGKGNLYAASIQMNTLSLIKGKQQPSSMLASVDSPLVLGVSSKEDAIAAALCHPSFLSTLPFCNLSVYITYAQNSYVLKRRLMKSTSPFAQLAFAMLSLFNLNYLFTVPSRSYRGARGNFGVLGKLMGGSSGAHQAYERQSLRKANDSTGTFTRKLEESTSAYLRKCQDTAEVLLRRPHYLSVSKRQEQDFLALNETLAEPNRARFDEEHELWYLPDSTDPDPFEPWNKTAQYLR